jgi:hypothetical protein
MHLPSLDPSTALQVAGAGGQVRVAEAIADLGGARCCGKSGLTVSLAETLLGDGKQQIAVLHAVAALDQTLCASEPAIRLPCLAPKQQRETEPEGAAGGAGVVTFLHAGVMGAIQRLLEVELPADQVGGCGQSLEILDGERR